MVLLLLRMMTSGDVVLLADPPSSWLSDTKEAEVTLLSTSVILESVVAK